MLDFSHPLLEKYKPEFEKVINHLKKELIVLRVGRANSTLVEDILVEAYGIKTPLKQLASISVPEARVILIQPWDKNILKGIEKAIREANIGLNPVNEGKIIRLVIPQLTEENRKKLVRTLSEKLEKIRISLRSIRDRIREEITKAKENKEITEDDKYRLREKLDEITKDYNQQIKELGEKKEEEIMTI